MKSSRLRAVDERAPELPLRSAPTEVRPEDIARQPSFGSALALGAAAAGLDLEKEVHIPLGIDAGHWTRMRSGEAGIQWKKLKAVCDLFGNDAPLLWMLYQQGYDLHSVRRRESEVDRENRELKEEIEQLKRDKRVLAEAMRTPIGVAR